MNLFTPLYGKWSSTQKLITINNTNISNIICVFKTNNIIIINIDVYLLPIPSEFDMFSKKKRSTACIKNNSKT